QEAARAGGGARGRPWRQATGVPPLPAPVRSGGAGASRRARRGAGGRCSGGRIPNGERRTHVLERDDMAPNGPRELPRDTEPEPPRHIASGSLDYVEELYLRYLADPASVSPEWQAYFASLGPAGPVPRHLPPRLAPRSPRHPA